MEINKFIDHTNIRPTATKDDIKKLCQEAKKFSFHSVCVTPVYVKLADKFLKNSGIKICTVIGFPHGSETPLVKAFSAKEAIKNGADEIDMVMNISALKSRNYNLVIKDIREVKKAIGKRILKVILETGYLTKTEIKKACQLAKRAGADFVKTCTGYGPGKANVSDIKLMRKVVGKNIGVKASGGIRDYQTALKMIKAGANRIGTSAGTEIMIGKRSSKNY